MKNMEKKLESAELWCIRRMLGVIWSDRVISNEEIWRRAHTMGMKKDLLATAMKRQMAFVGHIVVVVVKYRY